MSTLKEPASNNRSTPQELRGPVPSTKNAYESRITQRNPRVGTPVVPMTPITPITPSVYNDINSNPNIFPSSRVPRMTFSNDPVSLSSQHGMNYVPYDTQSSTKQIDPLSQMSRDFDIFARSVPTPIQSKVLPNDVLVPPSQPVIEKLAMVPNNEDDKPEEDLRMTLEKNLLGDKRMATYAYPQVYQEPTPIGRHFLQPPQNNLILNPKPLYLHIDSTYRNRLAYPNPASYVIPLVSSDPTINTPGERYKNIYAITLMSATIPNIPSVYAQPFLFLYISEIEGHYDSMNPVCTKAFTKMVFNESSVSAFIKLDKDITEPATVMFYPAPLASLSKLSISIRNPDGTLFDFGTDTTPPQVPNPALQNTFTFQIVNKVVDVIETIGHRNP